ncbi:saccharopine dehydrogenase NADP-binding domain-containing protein [Streptomyces sp. NPDC058221]|uniref:saccharopine dehydrogenase NADP-binding domain-containing protein n=1 Tax=Streptomyces sp. NPDC058221 TaxID=3346388 RepID=UPI0036F089BC
MTPNTRTDEVWILGATGRIGRAVAARLTAQGVTPVLVGRDQERLHAAGAALGKGDDVKLVVADTAERIAAEITRERPAVVVNTLGEYARTGALIARACMPGGHYVDMAADMVAIPRLLSLHREAGDAGSTLVTGAGFGVLATEAVVAKLCEGRPTPQEVRVDALGSVATEAGVMGAAFATSSVDVLATGGRRYRGGRLVRARLGADPQHIALPDGEAVKSAGAPSGELLAAQRASGAPSVTVTSALVPASFAARTALPVLGMLVSVPALRRLAIRQMAGMTAEAAPPAPTALLGTRRHHLARRHRPRGLAAGRRRHGLHRRCRHRDRPATGAGRGQARRLYAGSRPRPRAGHRGRR